MERAREQLEARHAADVGEARGIAEELRKLLTVHEAEAAKSVSEASDREKMLLEAHQRDLDQLRREMTEGLQRAKDEQVGIRSVEAWDVRDGCPQRCRACPGVEGCAKGEENAATLSCRLT